VILDVPEHGKVRFAIEGRAIRVTVPLSGDNGLATILSGEDLEMLFYMCFRAMYPDYKFAEVEEGGHENED